MKEFEKAGELITKVIKGLSQNPNDNQKVEEEVRDEVISLCSNFPIYKNFDSVTRLREIKIELTQFTK